MKKFIAVFLSAGLLALTAAPAFADAYKGRKVFKRKLCHNCHAVSPRKKHKLRKKGTYLRYVGKRRTRAWLKRYLLNPREARKKDPKLMRLSKKFKKPMKKTRLTPNQMRHLLDYLMSLK